MGELVLSGSSTRLEIGEGADRPDCPKEIVEEQLCHEVSPRGSSPAGTAQPCASINWIIEETHGSRSFSSLVFKAVSISPALIGRGQAKSSIPASARAPRTMYSRAIGVLPLHSLSVMAPAGSPRAHP